MWKTHGTNSNSLFIHIYLATFNISQVKVPFQIIGKNNSRINKHSNATYTITTHFNYFTGNLQYVLGTKVLNSLWIPPVMSLKLNTRTIASDIVCPQKRLLFNFSPRRSPNLWKWEITKIVFIESRHQRQITWGMRIAVCRFKFILFFSLRSEIWNVQRNLFLNIYL